MLPLASRSLNLTHALFVHCHPILRRRFSHHVHAVRFSCAHALLLLQLTEAQHVLDLLLGKRTPAQGWPPSRSPEHLQHFLTVRPQLYYSPVPHLQMNVVWESLRC
jgi:hypothetical protein